MRFVLGCNLVLILFGALTSATAQPVKQGAATYYLSPRGSDKPPPAAQMRTGPMQYRAAPTNQWYSTLLFNPAPEALFAHPVTYKTTSAGFEMALASREVVPTERRDVEIHYPHKDAIVLSAVAFPMGMARLVTASDWAIDMVMGQGTEQMLATVAHASPFAWFQLSRGDLRLKLPAAGERFALDADARALALRIKGKSYAIFGPTGVRWEQMSANEWIGHLPEGKGYFSAAALPDDKPESVTLFARHAYAFVTGTQAAWRYDQAASKVVTTYTVKTRIMEGPDNGPLIGLYPHQWFDNPSVTDRLGASYDSIRGPIRLLAANEFQTKRNYTGFVPYWPGIQDGPRAGEINDQLKLDFRKRRELIPDRENAENWRVSAYWQGKGLTRVTQLAAVAEQQGDISSSEQLLALARERFEYWFSGQGPKSYFHLDKQLGTVVTYPDEFFAVEQMNDHHFHYGYWIRAAAEIAMRDPQWAAKDKWGSMVDLLVSDIATAQRGRADFPFLRNFDVYEGHSWASGVALGEWGNNQESSSEAVNAWAALILWGEVTGNRELRDLGIYLYTTETEAINYYWFDIHHQVFPSEYKSAEVSMVFGGKYAHNTWWTDEPRQIHGINLLPLAPFSTYLGRDPAFIKRNMDAMAAETVVYNQRGKFPPNPPPKDVWQDVFAKYLALSDPAAALKHWDRYGSVEGGDTRTHTLHWMLSLQEMGLPDFTTTANTPLYSVFRQLDGHKTYLAYNAGKSPLKVSFSDGKTLTVAPGALGRGE